MNRFMSCLQAAACAGVAVSTAAFAGESVTFRSVVLSTDVLPTPELPVVVGSLGLVGRPWATINDSGEVAFIATSGEQRGYWHRSVNGPLGYLAQGGRRVPGRPTATMIGASFATEPQMTNGSAGAVFRVQVADETLGGDRRRAVLAGRPGAVSVVAGFSSQAPGTETGTVFTNFGEPAAAPGQGVAFSGALVGPNTGTLNGGIWRLGSSGVELVARRGTQAPGQAAGVLFGESTAIPSGGGTGGTLFRSVLQGSGVTELNRNSYWKQTVGAPVLLFRPTLSQVAGFNAETRLQEISPAFSPSGMRGAGVGYMAGGGVLATNNLGVYTYDEASGWSAALREGSRLNPADASSRVVVDFAGALPLGPAAFQSDFNDILVASVRTAPVGQDGRLSLVRRIGDGAFNVLADVGSRAPLLPDGVVLSSYFGMTMNARGQIAFSARLSGSGVTPANDLALYATMPDGSLTLVAREGGSMVWGDGDGTIATIATDAAIGGTSAATFNASGELVFGATLVGGRLGIFVAAVPAPASLGLLSAGLLAAGVRRRMRR
jgi:hypothetical protein